MGGYYVPNIQRPGFGYQRRSEDDEDEFGGSGFGDPSDWGGSAGTPASDGPDASSATGGYSPLAANSPAQGMQSMSTPAPAVQNPDWLSGMDWAGSSQANGQSDSFGSPLRGGAGATPTDTEMNLTRPAGPGGRDFDNLEPPRPQDAEIPTGTDIPGIGQPPMGRPSRVPPPVSSHAEQEKLKEMIRVGPKRNVLGTIAGMAAKFGAGYVNAAGRTRNPVPVPTQTARDWALRAPGGGAWDTKLARQKELAEQEQGEEKRALTAQQVQAQAEERLAMARRDEKYGDYLGEQAQTNRESKEEQARNNKFQRIMQLGGRGSADYQRVDIPPGGKPPAGDGWYIDANPYKPGYQLAVRPNPGREVTPEEGKKMNIAPDSQGKYYATPLMIKTAEQTELGYTNAQLRSTQADNERLRREASDKEKGEYHQGLLSLGAGREADQAEARQARLDADREKRDAAINSARDTKLTSAQVWGNAARDKKVQTQGIVKPEDEAMIAKEVLRRSQSAYDEWSGAIRSRGGSAADFTVYPDGSVAQSTESYGRGGRPVPLGAAPAPAPAPTPTGGGRGGRGNVPPPVQTAPQGRTVTKAEVQSYAVDHKTDYANAAKVFADKRYTILP